MHVLKILRDMWDSLDQRGRRVMIVAGVVLIVLAFIYGFSDDLLGLL